VAAGVASLASIFSSYGSYATHQSFVDGLRPAVLVGAAVVAVGAVVAIFLPRNGRPVDDFRADGQNVA
jgi:hypothetical protein